MTTPSAALAGAREQFDAPPGYLAVASMGILSRDSVAAMKDDLDACARGRRTPPEYDAVVDRARAAYAGLVGVPVGSVAFGTSTATAAALVAATLPEGAEVVAPAGEFASTVLPFLQAPGLRVRFVELAALADEIRPETDLVAFSLIQSATGEVADLPAVLAAAERNGALTFADLTQASGVYPVEAGLVDYSVCHTYKWLCSPRAVAFLTVSDRGAERLAPLQAGWYSAGEVWRMPYVPGLELASDARRFDGTPAWQSFVGAAPAIELFAGLDTGELWAHASGLGDLLCRELGIPEQHQAIVTWPDADGDHLRRLSAAGLAVSGRAGRLRASFHLWNDESDVEAVLRAIR